MQYVIERITENKPLESIEFAVKGVMSMLGRKAADPKSEQVDSHGLCTLYSVTFIMWEASTQLLEWVVKTVKKSKTQSVDINQRLFFLLKHCLEFSTNDPLIQRCYVSVFGILSSLYSADEKALMTVISKV